MSARCIDIIRKQMPYLPIHDTYHDTETESSHRTSNPCRSISAITNLQLHFGQPMESICSPRLPHYPGSGGLPRDPSPLVAALHEYRLPISGESGSANRQTTTWPFRPPPTDQRRVGVGEEADHHVAVQHSHGRLVPILGRPTPNVTTRWPAQ